MEENNKILTELPMYTEGRFKGKINRLAMVGMELELLYEGEIYTGVKVLEYIKGSHSRFVVEYNGQTYNIQCGNFIKGKFGGILGVHTKDFKVNLGDVFKFKDYKRDMSITDREYRKDKSGQNRKWYKYTCNKCGWTEGWIVESSLLSGIGCSCCAGKTAVLGINTIWDADRWLCSLGVSEEDAKTHTRSSHEKVTVTCPECGKTKDISIDNIYNRRSISCTCGDGVKYPEKFMTSVLEQLNIEYIFQLTKTTFDWCEDKRYDFYIPSLNTIIETHGMQHYEDCWGKAKDVQENDRIKYELALQNGIKDGDYVVIDCRYSDAEWIKNSILNSKLNELFDLSEIDWIECGKKAQKNLVKEVCEYWNNNRQEWGTTKTLAEVFGLSRDTIVDYLKKGAGLGWCEYDAKEEMIKTGRLNGKSTGKRVAMYDLNRNFIMEEYSTRELARRAFKEMGIKLGQGNISEVCNGKRKHHKGYTFKYIED